MQVSKEHLNFLTGLKRKRKVTLFDAISDLMNNFDLSRTEAKEIFKYWKNDESNTNNQRTVQSV